uniref:Uncharacterized protein n=1 Tax=Magnetococcus massalia (strain MO-1) TaxID=451514 RepID=A0A1S7LLH7_MAGMO|nr:protein of unknown function [Candidatus Magnetococcus massalia]
MLFFLKIILQFKYINELVKSKQKEYLRSDQLKKPPILCA